MKILLVQTLSYVYSRGGAHKANRILMEGLAARGHECRVVAPASGEPGTQGLLRFQEALQSRGLTISATTSQGVMFDDHGVQVYAVNEDSKSDAWHARRLRAALVEQIRSFEPTWVLVVDDYAGTLLETALEAAPGRVVTIVHTPAALPFGPSAFYPTPTKVALLEQVTGIITVSEAMCQYIREWGGLDAEMIRFPVYGNGPFPHFDNFDTGYVMMVNPSAIKGVSIFTELAQRRPELPFAAVPTWGTTNVHRERLAQIPNVTLLKPTDTIDELFAQTRVLLAPSLWFEAFGQIVVEAMLRGIPVIASDSGGLLEAKLGVEYVVPVRPITRYEQRVDDQLIPIPVIPEQDVGPWEQALTALLSDPVHYRALSVASRRAALAYIATIGIAPFERYLKQLAVSPRAMQTQRAAQLAQTNQQLAGLDQQRRALLAMRLRRPPAP